MPQVAGRGCWALIRTPHRHRSAGGRLTDQPNEAADAHGEEPDAAEPDSLEAAPEHDAELEAEPDALDWHSRKLLGQLYHAVVSHLEFAEQEPSGELHWLLDQVRAELYG